MLIPWEKKHGLEYSESSLVNNFQQMMSVSFRWVSVSTNPAGEKNISSHGGFYWSKRRWSVHMKDFMSKHLVLWLKKDKLLGLIKLETLWQLRWAEEWFETFEGGAGSRRKFHVVLAVRLMYCLLLGKYQGYRHGCFVELERSQGQADWSLWHTKVSTARVLLPLSQPEGLSGCRCLGFLGFLHTPENI